MDGDELAGRVREYLTSVGVDAPELRMFGGIAFTVNGNMAVAASERGLMVRVGPDAYDDAMGVSLDVEPVIMRGRSMRGWVRVTGRPLDDDDQLAEWVTRGFDFAGTLPTKR
jgi:hypothetical protein